MTVMDPTRRSVSESTLRELRVGVEHLNTEWRQDPSEARASYITSFFRDWRYDLSAVGLWCMWLRYQESGDVDALLDELTRNVR